MNVINVPPNASWGIWLHCPTTSGGKDWIGFQTPQGYIAYWGKTNNVSQSKEVVGNLQRTISGKLAKGYTRVSEWTLANGWQYAHEQNVPKNVPTPTTSKPAVREKNWATEINNPESSEWF